ncbi:uncharacterized protein LOC129732962 [Wyeomyia smithii]|uniref:uncharacterized protein LOC129732962 n=1 Tax=Wyeomyia smithii TaxID=174621 RepID=UPI002467FDE6|nr:uncharacterized protein LOC129732962 [Wyeomyia smithii]
MDCQQKRRINRSGNDHAALVSRSSGRKQPEKPPAVVRATQSVCNLSRLAAPKTRNKFTVINKVKTIQKQLFSVPKPEPAEPSLSPVKRFPVEKSLTMIEISSPSKKQKEQETHDQQENQEHQQGHGSLEDLLVAGRCSSATALPREGLDRMVSRSSKLIYETGFKLLLKCYRNKKREIHQLNTLLCRKENDVSKFNSKFQTIQSLYQTECRNHELARSDIRSLKLKLKNLKANLLEEKTAHLAKVSELEESLVRRGELQSQLTSTEDELAKAIICWHDFECKWKQEEERTGLLKSEKLELLKQIDMLEDNFKNFEHDYNRMLADHINAQNMYEARIGSCQRKLEEVTSQLAGYEMDCQLLKEWNVRLAADLAQVRGNYQSTYSYRMKHFFANLPRKPGFYVQYVIYLLVRGAPLPKRPSPVRDNFHQMNIVRF